VAVERQQLHRLLKAYRPVLEKCASTPPNDIELSALAAMLHSFYNGIENIFKRIAEELDGQLPRGQAWHRELLDLMGEPGKARPALICESLVERLDSYLDFRHFFRPAKSSTYDGTGWRLWCWAAKRRSSCWKTSWTDFSKPRARAENSPCHLQANGKSCLFSVNRPRPNPVGCLQVVELNEIHLSLLRAGVFWPDPGLAELLAGYSIGEVCVMTGLDASLVHAVSPSTMEAG